MAPAFTTRLSWVLGVLLCALMLVPLSVAAADPLGIKDDKILEAATGLQTNWNVVQAINAVINFLLGLTGLVALLAIVWGGFRMIAGMGSETQVAAAKKTIFWAIVGLIVVGLAWAIISLVTSQLLGVTV